MKDILSDIVSHTNKLGFLNVVKITGTEESTLINSIADDRSVVMYGETANPYPEMIGVFGMPQLEKLRYLVEGKEYKEDAKIEIIIEDREGEKTPVGIHFENKDGDFKNDYRFMSQSIINEKIKSAKFKGVKWNVETTPSIESIQRFQFQAGANPEHTTFTTKTTNNQLKFLFGEEKSHGGEFVFASGITGKLSRELSWPVAPILGILKIADVNNTTMSISDEGAMQLTLDSGMAVYKYIIPAQS